MTVSTETDEKWMRHALALADHAEREGEVPIGAVMVYQDEIIGEGWNRPILTHDPSAHAEIIALRAAGARIGNYRLCDATLYVTLEPCAMCAGAMLLARIARLVYGASDPKTGAAGGVVNVLEGAHALHRISVEGGVLAGDCGEQLRKFFRARRKKPD